MEFDDPDAGNKRKRKITTRPEPIDINEEEEEVIVEEDYAYLMDGTIDPTMLELVDLPTEWTEFSDEVTVDMCSCCKTPVTCGLLANPVCKTCNRKWHIGCYAKMYSCQSFERTCVDCLDLEKNILPQEIDPSLVEEVLQTEIVLEEIDPSLVEEFLQDDIPFEEIDPLLIEESVVLEEEDGVQLDEIDPSLVEEVVMMEGAVPFDVKKCTDSNSEQSMSINGNLFD